MTDRKEKEKEIVNLLEIDIKLAENDREKQLWEISIKNLFRDFKG